MLRRHDVRRVERVLLGAGLALAFASCASGPAPIDHFYRLDAGVADARAVRKLSGNLQVDRFRSDALTGERNLLYREHLDDLEIRQHPYHRWSDPPAILLQTELVSFLSAAGVADIVMPASARAKPDYVVKGRVLHFERVLEPDVRAVVEIHLMATSASGDEVLVNQTYREERAAAGSGVASSAVAFSEAVQIIFEHFLADLGGA